MVVAVIYTTYSATQTFIATRDNLKLVVGFPQTVLRRTIYEHHAHG